MKDHWKKINAEKVGEIIDLNELAAESKALLSADMWPESFIEELSKSEQWLDAVKVLSHALPRREAVWWACMCATQMEALASDESERMALEAAEKWVYQPSDDHRADAFRQVQKSRSNSVGTLCALAAAFSEETLPLGDGQEMEVDSTGFPKIVIGTILMAAGEGNGSQFKQRLQNFLHSGIDIACGGNGVIAKEGE